MLRGCTVSAQLQGAANSTRRCNTCSKRSCKTIVSVCHPGLIADEAAVQNADLAAIKKVGFEGVHPQNWMDVPSVTIQVRTYPAAAIGKDALDRMVHMGEMGAEKRYS